MSHSYRKDMRAPMRMELISPYQDESISLEGEEAREAMDDIKSDGTGLLMAARLLASARSAVQGKKQAEATKRKKQAESDQQKKAKDETTKEVVGDTLLPPPKWSWPRPGGERTSGTRGKTMEPTEPMAMETTEPGNDETEERVGQEGTQERGVVPGDGGRNVLGRGGVSNSLSSTKERAAHCRETSEKEKGEGEGEAESTMPSKRPENTDTHEE